MQSSVVIVLVSTWISVDATVCSSRDAECKIPFLYNGHLHFECSSSSPVTGDIVGRCPTRLANQQTRQASLNASHWEKCSRNCPLTRYTSNSQIVFHLQALAEEYPHLAEAVHVGKSVLGQSITGIRITRRVRHKRELLKPKVRYSGNMHGNEPVGREMLNHLAEVLLRGYGRVDIITELVDRTDITIIPTINPDGFNRAIEGKCSGEDFKSGRLNADMKDINRDFPSWRDVNTSREDLFDGRQPETQVMMDMILSDPWVLSANFHDGAVVAAYPYNDYRDNHSHKKGDVHQTPDNLMFAHLARTYAGNHGTMSNNSGCTRFLFEDGITNGAAWYSLTGGMMDFGYLFTDAMEITLELSCCKYPSKYYLNREWERNRESLVQLLLQAHRGVKGMVVDESGKHLESATVVVSDSSGPVGRAVTTSTRGEFWKLLLPGQYTLTGQLNGCQAEPVQFVVTEEEQLVLHNLTINIRCRQKGVR